MARSFSLKTELLSLLLKVARLRMFKPLVTVFFKYMDHFLAVDRLIENKHWVAFNHPQPDYPLHILILPKQALASLSAVSCEGTPELYSELFALVQTLIADLQLEFYGYRLISNGGPNQSIPQWHWHLISEHPGVLND